MTILGTAKTASAKKMMLLGGGELGKEVVIEAQRLGVEVIVVDRYEDTPGHAGGAPLVYHVHAGR